MSFKFSENCENLFKGRVKINVNGNKQKVQYQIDRERNLYNFKITDKENQKYEKQFKSNLVDSVLE